MQVVPLQAIPNQTVTTTLGGQTCQIDIRTRRTGLFLDLYVANVLIIAGAICQDRNPVVRSVYLGFSGDFAFFDTQGTADPVYTGIGTRWFLAYVTAGDIFPQ